MKTRIISLALLICMSATAKAEGIDKAKLREAVRLPQMSLETSIQITSDLGIVIGSKERALRAEIASLEKGLCGDTSDAPRYSRLSELYDDPTKSKEAASRAVELFGSLAKNKPDDARLLADLGLTLFLSHDPAAEATLTKAIRLAPQDWYVSFVIGRYWSKKSVDDLIEKREARGLEKLESQQPTPEAIARSLKSYERALTWIERAERLAPKEPRPLLQRVCLRMHYALVSILKLKSEGKEDNIGVLAFGDSCLADLRKLSQLLPDDPKVMAAVAYVEFAGFVARNQRLFETSASALSAMPEDTKDSFLASLRKLEKLSLNNDPKIALCATEAGGALYLAGCRDYAKAADCFRRGVDLDQSRDDLWDMYICALLDAKKKDACLAANAARVRQKDSAWGRLIYCRMYYEWEQYDKAEEQIRFALQRDPKDLQCNLAFGELLIRRGTADSLQQAEAQLAATLTLMKKAPQGPKLAAHYWVDCAVFFALRDDLESCRKFLDAALNADPKGEYALKIRELIGK